MTMAAKDFAQNYVQLALAIEHHIPGYVDAYFGPSQWRDQSANTGPRPVTELAREAEGLLTAIDTDTEMDSQRRDYLARNVRAVQTSLRILQGEQLALADEVEALYDIRPEWVDEGVFEEAHEALDRFLPPGDTLAERMTIRKKRTELPTRRLLELLCEIAAQFRQRTRARFPLPMDESLELQLVTDQPWGAYNWYLGNCSSRIDINTDLPLHITGLADLIAHEGYPGHHTELSIKETRLMHEKGWIEHCVALINAPSCVVSEGIATRALSMLLTDDELIRWYAEELFPRSGFGHLEAQHEHAIDKAREKLIGVGGNAAFLLHDHGANEDEVTAYIMQYALSTEEEARKHVSFIKSPLFRSYVFTYRYGREMLDALFDAKDDRDHWFNRLISEPVTPNQIRTWITG